MPQPPPVHSRPDPTGRDILPHPLIGRLDGWMALHPWHPRVLPFLAYVCCLPLLDLARSRWAVAYPPLYVGQCLLVTWLLWRYRRWLPELRLGFHWLAVPVGVGVFAAWVLIGWAVAGEFPQRWDALRHGRLLPVLDYGKPVEAGTLSQVWEALRHGQLLQLLGYGQPAVGKPLFATNAAAGPLDFRQSMGPVVGWIALALRLLGMSLLVPAFEELFIRSLLLRSLHRFRRTAIGFVQLVQDLPLVGEWLMHTDLGTRAGRHPPVFGPEFAQTPLGQLSVFGVAASTLAFMVNHHPSDYPGAIVCGLAYCGLLAAVTRNGRRPQAGLGAVIWAHGITNALLWAYTVYSGDWQFL